MVTVIRAKRRSPVLMPSGLACLSALPTVNLTAGCLHDCAYCNIAGTWSASASGGPKAAQLALTS